MSASCCQKKVGNGFLLSIGAGVALLAGWAMHRWTDLPHGLVLGIYGLSYALGGADLAWHQIKAWAGGRFKPDIDLLMLLAAIGAAILGHFAEGAFLLFLFSLAHAMEHYAMGRARSAISALADLAPAHAMVRREGQVVELLVEDVQVGDVVLVQPSQRIAVDGQVRQGHSSVDQSPITGESIPVEKEMGDEVFAGSINGQGALEITTTKASGDRTLDRVIRLVEEAQAHKAPTQRFTDRFDRIFVPGVLIASTLLIIIPPLVDFWPWATSFYRGMALLVAASPCALALGTPSAVLAGIAQAARQGVLIKGGQHLELLGGIHALAFDKTGTLTTGRPEVTEVLPMAGVTVDQLLHVAGSVEQQSQHPLAAAVVRKAKVEQITLTDAGQLQSVTARGVQSTLDGKTVAIGSQRLFEDTPLPDQIASSLQVLTGKARSVMIVRHGENWLGVIGLADQPRPRVRHTLERLRELDIRTLVMLSGDNAGVANDIARQVGIDQVMADLLPQDKVTAIEKLLAEHGQVAMVGDGVNDAPALATATVGIAMGGAGTAAALETADAALMGDDLARLPFAIALSRQARRIITQNLVIALGTIVFLIFATTTGLVGIGPAVFLHEGSTLVVIANSLRLLAYRKYLEPPVSV